VVRKNPPHAVVTDSITRLREDLGAGTIPGRSGLLPLSGPRVLLLTTKHLGTAMFCTPAIRLLKKHRPALQFDVVAMSRRAASVFENNSDVDRVFCTSSKRRIRRIAAHYERVLGLHGDTARHYLNGWGSRLICIGHPLEDEHRAESILRFAQRLVNCRVEEADRHYVLRTEQNDHDFVASCLPSPDRRAMRVGFHLGNGRTNAHGWKFWYWRRTADPRLWPVENYVSLAKMLQATDREVEIVVTGSRSERFLGRRFERKVPGVVNLVGRTSLPQLAALMGLLDVLVTQDTGALHVGCATPVAVVALFGPTRPEQTGPYPLRAQHALIRRDDIETIAPIDVFQAIVAAFPQVRDAAN
jgi:ADP-heptose:LPS heptosyltransferase